ncbi:phosphatidylserine decarboxylase proenzyme [Striga asiatica]|uniref:phosphatidylserine decarboxylase n=1 Tax=Striga asiatica TaxID=4170 RepID=A0A5A7NZA5_STRAF|nr:phosphatidylserine decarboxylase proenzyme [Striga asiatica]
MRCRTSRSLSVVKYNGCFHRRWRAEFTTFLRKVRPAQPRASLGGGSSSSTNSQGSYFLVPGATVATILMLGALHARRLYDDKKIEEARSSGVELEFHPDVKARFLRLLPLRSISRLWGSLTSVELPIWLRPYVYKAWARAFHSNLEEAQLPLEEYASLQDFFIRTLREGSRTIDSDPYCLISPVDGTVLRYGELKGPGAMIEQVKGFSYPASSLLGANSYLPMSAAGDANYEESGVEESNVGQVTPRSWWKISFASPKVRDSVSSRHDAHGNGPYVDIKFCKGKVHLFLLRTDPLHFQKLPKQVPLKGLFYCVIYLKPGDYHRIHSPVDWNILVRRHFTGHLFPVNERAARTIRNLYVENERSIEAHLPLPWNLVKLMVLQLMVAVTYETFFLIGYIRILIVTRLHGRNIRHSSSSYSTVLFMRNKVVLEGRWREGYMALAAIGATNIGSIKLFIEQNLITNNPRKKLLRSESPDEKVYEPQGIGMLLKKGDELAAFNMGSTVVLVFQAPISADKGQSEFRFCVKKGDRVRMGEALGRWNKL